MPDGQEIPLTPQGAALYRSRIAEFGKGSPSSHCLPHAVPDAMLFRPWKIVQNPRVTLILFEVFNHYRQIFTDGRGVLTDNPQPTWFGYSVGHWKRTLSSSQPTASMTFCENERDSEHIVRK